MIIYFYYEMEGYMDLMLNNTIFKFKALLGCAFLRIFRFSFKSSCFSLKNPSVPNHLISTNNLKINQNKRKLIFAIRKRFYLRK